MWRAFLAIILAGPVVLAHEAAHPWLKHTAGGDMPALPSQVEIRIEGEYRLIRASGLPDHTHGMFPNPGNPNPLAPQSETFRVPVKPKPADTPQTLRMAAFGVAVNGVPFEPSAAEFWKSDRRSGWQYEALSGKLELGVDVNHAHVQPNGKYHYHGMPMGLIDSLKGTGKVVLLGYAADGYPIYGPWGRNDGKDSTSGIKVLRSSYQLRTGSRPAAPEGPGGAYDGTFVQDYEFVAGSGDLDACNGRFAVTPEYPEGTYHYVITDLFPFIPRQFHGTPDPSFSHAPGGTGEAPAGRRGPPEGRNEQAGGPGGPGGPGGGRPADSQSLLMNQQLGEWLHLDNDQLAAVRETGRELHEQMRNGRSTTGEPQEIRDRMHEQRAAAQAKIDALVSARFTPAQQLRWQQLNRQLQGPDYLLTADARKSLMFSDSQFARIYGSIVAARAEAVRAGGITAWQAPLKLFTPEQHQAFDQLTGPLVNIKLQQQPPGRRP